MGTRNQKAGAHRDGSADLVFTTSRGRAIHEQRFVHRWFKPLLKSAALPDIRLYDLRHTAATLALLAGVSPKVLSEQLGHANVAFTLEVYSHLLPHMQETAATQVEGLLFPAQTRISDRLPPEPSYPRLEVMREVASG